MSSRQMRKLQKQRELEQAKAQTAEDSAESDQELPRELAKPGLFANLAALDDEGDDEVKEDSEDVKDEEQDLEAIPQKVVTPQSSSKSKKKKGRAKKAQAQQTPSKAPNKDGTDDIDEALRELNIQDGASGGGKNVWAPTIDPDYERVCKLLGVATQHLKVANEMRNLFGKTAVEAHDDAGGPAGRGGRRRQRAQNQQVDLETALKGQHAPRKGLPESTLRRNPFIQGKGDWPKATTGGLTMEIVEEHGHDDGTMEFRFVHDRSYQEVQQQFQVFVEMGVPGNLIGLLTQNPYHISLLIQVSKVAKDQGNHALASDLLERALFTFGRASISIFNSKIAAGKARLDFARPENRELWLAGYHYIRSLMMKGTYRTALEWAKLLLSLDPEDDPYAMRLMIHNLALRAHDLNWLLDIADPSAKLCEAEKTKWYITDGSHGEPSLAFAALQLREMKDCRQRLQASMKKLPWLFCRLFAEMNLDAPPSIWAIKPRTDAETLLTEIYVLQTKDLWNTPEATSLLIEVAHTLPKINIDAIPKHDNSTIGLDVVRFIYLDNNPSLMALAPSSILHREINSDADPLPPEHNTCSYWLQRAVLGGQSQDGPRNNFYHPLDAMRRLMHGGDGDEDDESDENDGDDLFEGVPRGDVAAMLRAAAAGVFDPNSWAGRMWDVFGRMGPWGGGEGDEEDDWEDDDEEDEESILEGDEDEDDDDLPPLVDEDGRTVEVEEEEEGETDEEMPELVAADHRLLKREEEVDTDEEMPELLDSEGRPVSSSH